MDNGDRKSVNDNRITNFEGSFFFSRGWSFEPGMVGSARELVHKTTGAAVCTPANCLYAHTKEVPNKHAHP